jgi:diaphanous 2
VTEVLRLLAAVCLLPPSGHMCTLEALTSLVIDDPDEGFRFRRLKEIVETADSLTLQVGVLQLVNALVTSPEELEFRMHLRNELYVTPPPAVLAHPLPRLSFCAVWWWRRSRW